LAVWTRDFFAILHPIRTQATYVEIKEILLFHYLEWSEIRISFFESLKKFDI
jgi:hypothetical protein